MIAQALLVAVLILATSVWVGGFVAIVIVARAASATLDPAARVRFFRALGRRYLWVGASSLMIALSLGAALLRNHPWDALLITSSGAALALLLLLAVAVRQARNMTQLRRQALEQPANEALREQVTRSGHRATSLRAALGLLTLVLLVLGALLASRCPGPVTVSSTAARDRSVLQTADRLPPTSCFSGCTKQRRLQVIFAPDGPRSLQTP